jgi:DNA-binding NarL/FixJ family response regulator
VLDESWQRFWLDEKIFGPVGRRLGQPRPISVLVAHDHLLYAEALILCIEIDERFEVVAHAADGWEALELAAGFHPDVVLTHPDLPGLDGTEVTLRLRHVCPGARVVMIAETTHESELQSVSALGADAYIGKDCSAHRLLSTIARIAEETRGIDSSRPVRRA